MLSGNSTNLIKSVFVAKGHTIKTFLQVLTQSKLFSHAKLQIANRLENQTPFSPPLEINFGNEKLTICDIVTSSFTCTAISTTLKSTDIAAIEILFCVPHSADNNARFEPSVSLTYKLRKAELSTIPAEASSIFKLFLNNSISQRNLPANYPVNFNNLTYESIMLYLNAHKKVQITQELANELTIKRKEKGYTQSQLADLSTNFLNTTDSPLNSLTISRIETRKINTVEIEKLYLLERTLQLPHGYFEKINNIGKNSPQQETTMGDKKGNATAYNQSSAKEPLKNQTQVLHLNIAYCTQCGTKILRAGDKFCSRCGAQLPLEEAGANVSVYIKQDNVLSRQNSQSRPPSVQLSSQSLSVPKKKAPLPREKGKASLRKMTYKF